MAPKAEKKPAKKVAKKVAGGKGKKGKSKVESFKIYIYKVLKQVSNFQAPNQTHRRSLPQAFSVRKLSVLPCAGTCCVTANMDCAAHLAYHSMRGLDALLVIAAGSPRYWYLQPCHLHPELLHHRHLREDCH